ncbi:MAG: rhomboid family intramembrane serine protease, partial [Muribaculaceae bacterium]
NAGGHIAHIGGALIGVLYAISFKKGIDITNWINKICDKIVLLFTRPSKYQFSNKNKNKYTYSAPKSNNENTMTSADMDAMNIILDKIKKSGYSSLSADEKKKLFDVSKKK